MRDHLNEQFGFILDRELRAELETAIINLEVSAGLGCAHQQVAL